MIVVEHDFLCEQGGLKILQGWSVLILFEEFLFSVDRLLEGHL